MTKIEMKALTYQSVPQGNDRQYVAKNGKFFVFSEQEALARVERGIAERLSAEAPSDEETAKQSETEDLSKPWTMQLDPETYLKKYPEGQHAEHARAVIAREGGGETKT